jgi:hypothetical protein
MTDSIDDSDNAKSQPQKIPKDDRLVVINKFLDIQYKELEIKTKEIESNDKQIGGNLEIAKLQMQLVAQDLSSSRADNQKTLTKYLVFSSSAVLMLVILLAIAFYLGKDEIAFEIIKAIIFIGTGLFGGYSGGFNQGRNSISEDSDK